MELNKPFSVPAVLGAEASPAEDENHWMLSLEFGELPTFRGVIGKLIVRENSPGNNVRSHIQLSFWLGRDADLGELMPPRIDCRRVFLARLQRRTLLLTNT